MANKCLSKCSTLLKIFPDLYITPQRNWHHLDLNNVFPITISHPGIGPVFLFFFMVLNWALINMFLDSVPPHDTSRNEIQTH